MSSSKCEAPRRYPPCRTRKRASSFEEASSSLPNMMLHILVAQWWLAILVVLSSCKPAGPTSSTGVSYLPTPESTERRWVSPTATPQTVAPSPIAGEATPPTQVPILSHLSQDGPWLVYGDGAGGLLALVNEDGSGRTPLTLTVYDPASPFAIADESNCLVILSSEVYLIRPHQGAAYHLVGDPRNFGEDFSRLWEVRFSGDTGAGFLASIRRQNPDSVPELVVHELPNGEIRLLSPLTQCPGNTVDCHLPVSDTTFPRDRVAGLGQLSWSPDGRYLAYAAMQGNSSSDLFVYDSIHDLTRQMTGGPNDIGKIYWSPSGKWIVFEGVSAHEESLWAVAQDGSQVRRLYTAPRYGAGQRIRGWLDEERFVSHNGYWEVEDAFSDLRLVNAASGQVRVLFDGDFDYVALDPIHSAIVLLPRAPYGSTPTWPGYGGYGFHMMSVDDTALQYIGDLQGRWDPDLEMFTTDLPCGDAQDGVQAFDWRGVIECIQIQRFPPTSPSPDGHWQVVIGDGIWLQTSLGEPVGQVSEDTPAQIIWRPDSQGFFLVAGHALNYVAVHDLSVEMIDDHLLATPIVYQWLDEKTD